MSEVVRPVDRVVVVGAGEPVHGRVLLAGEHTHSARTGYADGAYASGLRAAGRLGA